MNKILFLLLSFSVSIINPSYGMQSNFDKNSNKNIWLNKLLEMGGYGRINNQPESGFSFNSYYANQTALDHDPFFVLRNNLSNNVVADYNGLSDEGMNLILKMAQELHQLHQFVKNNGPMLPTRLFDSQLEAVNNNNPNIPADYNFNRNELQNFLNFNGQGPKINLNNFIPLGFDPLIQVINTANLGNLNNIDNALTIIKNYLTQLGDKLGRNTLLDYFDGEEERGGKNFNDFLDKLSNQNNFFGGYDGATHAIKKKASVLLNFLSDKISQLPNPQYQDEQTLLNNDYVLLAMRLTGRFTHCSTAKASVLSDSLKGTILTDIKTWLQTKNNGLYQEVLRREREGVNNIVIHENNLQERELFDKLVKIVEEIKEKSFNRYVGALLPHNQGGGETTAVYQRYRELLSPFVGIQGAEGGGQYGQFNEDALKRATDTQKVLTFYLLALNPDTLARDIESFFSKAADNANTIEDLRYFTTQMENLNIKKVDTLPSEQGFTTQLKNQFLSLRLDTANQNPLAFKELLNNILPNHYQGYILQTLPQEALNQTINFERISVEKAQLLNPNNIRTHFINPLVADLRSKLQDRRLTSSQIMNQSFAQYAEQMITLIEQNGSQQFIQIVNTLPFQNNRINADIVYNSTNKFAEGILPISTLSRLFNKQNKIAEFINYLEDFKRYYFGEDFIEKSLNDILNNHQNLLNIDINQNRQALNTIAQIENIIMGYPFVKGGNLTPMQQNLLNNPKISEAQKIQIRRSAQDITIPYARVKEVIDARRRCGGEENNSIKDQLFKEFLETKYPAIKNLFKFIDEEGAGNPSYISPIIFNQAKMILEEGLVRTLKYDAATNKVRGFSPKTKAAYDILSHFRIINGGEQEANQHYNALNTETNRLFQAVNTYKAYPQAYTQAETNNEQAYRSFVPPSQQVRKATSFIGKLYEDFQHQRNMQGKKETAERIFGAVIRGGGVGGLSKKSALTQPEEQNIKDILKNVIHDVAFYDEYSGSWVQNVAATFATVNIEQDMMNMSYYNQHGVFPVATTFDNLENPELNQRQINHIKIAFKIIREFDEEVMRLRINNPNLSNKITNNKWEGLED